MEKCLKIITLAGMMYMLALSGCMSATEQNPDDTALPLQEVDTTVAVADEFLADDPDALYTDLLVELPEFTHFEGTIVEMIPGSGSGAEYLDDEPMPNMLTMTVEGGADRNYSVRGNPVKIIFNVDQDSLVTSMVQLEVGMRVVVFYETMRRYLSSHYPPMVQAIVVIHPYVQTEGGLHVIDTGFLIGRFDENWNNVDAILMGHSPVQLNVSEHTDISFQDGNPFEGDLNDLIGRVLFVFMDSSAHFTYPQIFPAKIYVLFEGSEYPDHQPIEQVQATAWQEAYAALLRDYAVAPLLDEYIKRSFILHDINKDGIPELIITYIAAGIWGESIYTFKDDELVQLEFIDGFFAYYGIYARPGYNPGIIVQAYGNISLMQIDRNSFGVEVGLRQPFFGGGDRWYVNDEEVTEEEHNRMLETILVGGWDEVTQIWPYEITEANIQNVIFG